MAGRPASATACFAASPRLRIGRLSEDSPWEDCLYTAIFPHVDTLKPMLTVDAGIVRTSGFDTGKARHGNVRDPRLSGAWLCRELFKLTLVAWLWLAQQLFATASCATCAGSAAQTSSGALLSPAPEPGGSAGQATLIGRSLRLVVLNV